MTGPASGCDVDFPHAATTADVANKIAARVSGLPSSLSRAGLAAAMLCAEGARQNGHASSVTRK